MIELFDADRLVTRRDHSLPATALLLLLSATAVASYAHLLHGRLQRVQDDLQEMQNLVARGVAAPSAPRVPLDELRRQAEQLEREAAQDGQTAAQFAVPTSNAPSWSVRSKQTIRRAR